MIGFPTYDELRTAAIEAADQRDKLQRFKEYVHARLDAAGVPTDPDSPHKAEGCRIGGRLDYVLGRLHMHPEPPNPEHEALAAKLRAASLATEDGKPDGTRDALATCLKTLDTYTADVFPANEKGQVAFGRAVMESVAEELRAFLATTPK